MVYLSLAFSWLANANLAAFSCSLANLFSYLDTFFSVGLMNLPFMSLTDMLSSLIWRSRKMTSRCKKNISPSRLNHLSKYSLTIFLSSSSEAFSMSFLTPHLSEMTLSFLLFLKLLSSFLTQQCTELLLPLRGHKALLLGHLATLKDLGRRQIFKKQAPGCSTAS